MALLGSLCVAARASDACSTAYGDAQAASELRQCQQGAQAGDAESQFGYGLVLWSGHGRTPQPKEALEWFRQAARQKHRLARVMLGRMLSEPGVPAELRNPAEGYAWWVVAGERDAAAGLKERLSTAERAQAERFVADFKSAYGS